jgi:cation transport ATPase
LPGQATYYDVAALIITLIAVGKYLELAGRARAGAAIGYNLLLVPLAAGILPPVLAALAMATSSVTAVGNALRLRRFGSTSGHRAAPRHGLVAPAAQPPAGMPISS